MTQKTSNVILEGALEKGLNKFFYSNRLGLAELALIIVNFAEAFVGATLQTPTGPEIHPMARWFLHLAIAFISIVVGFGIMRQVQEAFVSFSTGKTWIIFKESVEALWTVLFAAAGPIFVALLISNGTGETGLFVHYNVYSIFKLDEFSYLFAGTIVATYFHMITIVFIAIKGMAVEQVQDAADAASGQKKNTGRKHRKPAQNVQSNNNANTNQSGKSKLKLNPRDFADEIGDNFVVYNGNTNTEISVKTKIVRKALEKAQNDLALTTSFQRLELLFESADELASAEEQNMLSALENILKSGGITDSLVIKLRE